MAAERHSGISTHCDESYPLITINGRIEELSDQAHNLPYFSIKSNEAFEFSMILHQIYEYVQGSKQTKL